MSRSLKKGPFVETSLLEKVEVMNRANEKKAGLVLDLIRGKAVPQALATLKFSPKGVARDIEKVLRSAVANATQKDGFGGETDRPVRQGPHGQPGPPPKPKPRAGAKPAGGAKKAAAAPRQRAAKKTPSKTASAE